MKELLVASVALAMAGLSGCVSRYADVPAPVRFSNVTQSKLQAAKHWQIIAEHAAGELAKDLRGKLNGRPLFVPQPGGEQAFVEGFRELLITALVGQGLAVAVDPRNALVVDVRYAIFRFRPDRLKETYYYGEATALAAGLWAVGGLVTATVHSSTPAVAVGATALTLAAAADGFGWLRDESLGMGQYASGRVPQSEILLTATVTESGRIISRSSSIYYASDDDAALYWPKPASAASSGNLVSVVGDCDNGRSKCGR